MSDNANAEWTRDDGTTIRLGTVVSVEEPFAWVCYHHDMGVHIVAIFAEEIDALRFAVGSGYLKVAPVGIGEIGNLT